MSSFNLQIISRQIAELRPSPRNARTHSKVQLAQIRRSIEKFGFVNPVLIRDDGEIVCGHGRVKAASELGIRVVPTISLTHLSDAELRAYLIADNQLALKAGWDQAMLAIEFQGLLDLNFDVELTGFDQAQIDFIIEDSLAADPSATDEPEDRIPSTTGVPVCLPGEIWCLGRHRLMCGDARQADQIATLMNGDKARIAFLDPPYNVAVNGHVSGNRRVEHREFPCASGEMSKVEFTRFLTDSFQSLAGHLIDGAIAYICSDWRHCREMLDAGEAAFTEQKNLIVWNKGSGGQSTFYRSQHELIFVFKNGTAAHTNNFGLGETGRYRTNLWTMPGMSSFGSDRDKLLSIHPTCKPVALVADALKDCSKKGEIVVDTFAGSGTTLIAAEKTGRSARAMELDPLYCDTIIRRWQEFTGKIATTLDGDQSFADREINVEEDLQHGK